MKQAKQAKGTLCAGKAPLGGARKFEFLKVLTVRCAAFFLGCQVLCPTVSLLLVLRSVTLLDGLVPGLACHASAWPRRIRRKAD